MSEFHLHQRLPGRFTAISAGLDLEGKGALGTVLSILYCAGEPLTGTPREIAPFLGVSTRKTRVLLDGLVADNRLIRTPDGALTEATFDRLRLDGWFRDPPQDRQPLPPRTRLRILARDGLVCRYCDDEFGPFHIDHIVPVARGGGDEDENLCVACRPCNLSKGAKLLSEWTPQ